MRWLRVVCVTVVLATTVSQAMVAQGSDPGEATRVQIRQTLRAFYFNLARGDWEALTADILAAKVVAHRSPPAATLPNTRETEACAGQSPRVDDAAITLTDDWAEVFVPRCGAALAGADQFRMIHFEQRWRFVAIHLYQEPLNFSAGP